MSEGSYRAGMLDANEALRLLAALVIFTMVGVFGYAILTGVETVTTIAALVLLALFTFAFVYVFFSPDTVSYTHLSRATSASTPSTPAACFHEGPSPETSTPKSMPWPIFCGRAVTGTASCSPVTIVSARRFRPTCAGSLPCSAYSRARPMIT